jgi:sugar lactone lactonase YvrE
MHSAEAPEVEIVLEVGDELGSAPVWDIETGTLWWVDVLGRRLHRLQTGENTHETFPLPTLAAAFALSGNKSVVLATMEGFAHFDTVSEQLTVIARCAPDGLRMNDGKCDAAGRFWAGTTQRGPGALSGSLFVLDTDGSVRRFLDNIVALNGPAWSPDGTVMYFTDTPTRTIDRVEFDLERGVLGARELLVHVPDLIPDGFAVDEEGCLWVALFGSGRIGRFSPSGEHLADVPLPTENPTGCAFGGVDRRSLYITTARVGGGRSGIDYGPLAPPPAGALLRVDAGVRGLPMYRYGLGG